MLITHKLHEAIEMGDRVSILRSGRKVGSIDPADLRGRGEEELRGEIVRMMFGDETPEVESAIEISGAEAPREARSGGRVVLSVADRSSRASRRRWASTASRSSCAPAR